MLQQTQVNTVIPYYERWMKNFPHLGRLAAAPLSRVLKSWEGLGYYSRARNLHRTAKIIVKKWGGKFPDSRETLEMLPGIGGYTAGAIASIAFNKPEPILDGNVKRVLARVFALREPVDQTNGEKKLWVIAHELVVGVGLVPARGVTHRAPTRGAPTGAGLKYRYGDFNQSLMELGALVCLPENPKCFACPLGKTCQAHRLKKEMEFPVRAHREKTERLKTVAVVIWKNGRVLLEKQPLRARWGGLWMFPQWVYKNGKPERDFLKEKVQQERGVEIRRLRPKAEIEHGFTKYRVRLRVYEGEALSHNGLPAMTRWIKPEKLALLPLPRPHQKIAALIQNHA